MIDNFGICIEKLVAKIEKCIFSVAKIVTTARDAIRYEWKFLEL